ncbi:hypothetical protein ACP4OV_007508 [Aristida adscensionis]
MSIGGGGGGGGDVVKPQTRTEQEGGPRQRPRQTTATPLPLDVVLEIAARSDAPTLIRCAATCRDMRGRVAGDEAFLRGRLRLRHADDGRFVLPLLRGHLLQVDDYCDHGIQLVAGSTARLLTAAEGFPPPPPLGRQKLVSSRDGLLLVGTAAADAPPHRLQWRLRVCDPATGRSHTLPPEPELPCEDKGAPGRAVSYVLLVGDRAGAVGRPFQVLKARLVLSKHRRYLRLQTFSPEHGAWGPHTELRTPQIHGHRLGDGELLSPLVAGGAVHWLYLTTTAGYVLKLHAGAGRVSVSALPESFPLPESDLYPNWRTRYLLATAAAAGGSPAVLVADAEKISAWAQEKRVSGRWKTQPQVVVTKETIMAYGARAMPLHLASFAERSGVVLVRINACHYLLLELRSMAIVSELKVSLYPTVDCPYEMDFWRLGFRHLVKPCCSDTFVGFNSWITHDFVK